MSVGDWKDLWVGLCDTKFIQFLSRSILDVVGFPCAVLVLFYLNLDYKLKPLFTENTTISPDTEFFLQCSTFYLLCFEKLFIALRVSNICTSKTTN